MDPVRRAGAEDGIRRFHEEEGRLHGRIASHFPRVLGVVPPDAENPADREDAVAPGHRYEISDVHLFDLFPQTYHIETLVKLRRVT